jgi:NADP-dependent aldehyde dehydrogenase
MEIHGSNIIGFQRSALGKNTFRVASAFDNGHQFFAATDEEIDTAMQMACEAFQLYRNFSGARKAAFLRAIAAEIESLGRGLIETAMVESGLPEGRLAGECGRTCGQLRLMADQVEEGSWVEAVIDYADPARAPLPRPDIRRMLVPLGPVVVFTASNFPLAFSTAGGDTAAALAAGCPVVVKAHEAHPATNELVALAIQRAAQQTGMPDGVFSSLNGDYQTGQSLVVHLLTTAVAFTGSHAGGKALYDLAVRRPVPIPVFAEMGSVNPVFILPGLSQEQLREAAQKIAASVSLGAGQFCTNPGLLFVPEEDTGEFTAALGKALSGVAPQCMLNHRIFESYLRSLQQFRRDHEVTLFCEGQLEDAPYVRPSAGMVSEQEYLKKPALQEEVFGPFTLVVTYLQPEGLATLARALRGQLTATVFAVPESLDRHRTFLDTLRQLAGRLLFNGVPTGVEVGHAMQHGGPFPATTDSRFTSVGTGSLKRFVRPLAFQDFPQDLLPPELKDDNPLRIWRMENGKFIAPQQVS